MNPANFAYISKNADEKGLPLRDQCPERSPKFSQTSERFYEFSVGIEPSAQ